LAEKSQPAWRRFLSQFNDAFVMLALLAMAISTSYGFTNATNCSRTWPSSFSRSSFSTRRSALCKNRGQQPPSLRLWLPMTRSVIRDGKAHCVVTAFEIVPGDFDRHRRGDTVAADVRVVESAALQTDEAASAG